MRIRDIEIPRDGVVAGAQARRQEPRILQGPDGRLGDPLERASVEAAFYVKTAIQREVGGMVHVGAVSPHGHAHLRLLRPRAQNHGERCPKEDNGQDESACFSW